MDSAEESIDAEFKPTWGRPSYLGALFLALAVVELLFVFLEDGVSGRWADYWVALAYLTAFVVVYPAGHTWTPAEARFDDGRFVVRNPNPWWKRIFGPTWKRELQLEVDSTEQKEGELLVTGSYRWWSKYRVSLKPKTQAAEAVENRLTEMVRE